MITVSLIITTYNWPKAINKTLHSILNQTRRPDEVIIADDGSTPETAKLINGFKVSHPEFTIIHSWQEDKGFRLSKSRNIAIKGSKSDYIVLVDGDMILDKHFIEDHLLVAQKGVLVSGRRILLNEKYSNKILENEELPTVMSFGIKKHRLLGIRSHKLTKLRSSTNQRIDGILGCNMGFFRDDAIMVNGFNEAFVGWGAEDTEFIARLINNGFYKMKLKHLAFGYHLYHPEASRDFATTNCELLNTTLTEGLKFCEYGIQQPSNK